MKLCGSLYLWKSCSHFFLIKLQTTRTGFLRFLLISVRSTSVAMLLITLIAFEVLEKFTAYQTLSSALYLLNLFRTQLSLSNENS